LYNEVDISFLLSVLLLVVIWS